MSAASVAFRALIASILVGAAPPSFAEPLRYGGDLIRREASPDKSATAFSNAGRAAEIVDVDVSVLANDPDLLWLELVEGQGRWAHRTEIERESGSDLVWRGRFEDDTPGHSSITLTLHDGLLLGTFHPPGGPVHLLRPSRGRGAELRVLDPAEVGCAVGNGIPHAGPLESLPGPAPVDPTREIHRSAESRNAGASAGRTIYVLVLYTPESAASRGSRELEVAAHHNVDFMNTTFANSRIDGRARLATAVEADLGFLFGRGVTGAMETAMKHPLVRELRDHWRADVVVVVANNRDFSVGCGLANVMTNGLVGPQMADRAFSILEDRCFNGFTFTHEIGHNLGAQHNHENAYPIEQAAYPFSFAHGAEGYFRTLMSYPSACADCYFVMDLFSNPLVIRDGVSAGIPDERDNARTLKLTLPIAAAFRTGTPPGPPPPPPVPPTPAPPVDLRASPVSPTEIALEWLHDRYDVTGFQIETRQEDAWKRIATVPLGDETTHRVTGLAPDTEYQFRIRAMNGLSASGYSEMATARTLPGVPDAPSGLSAEPLSESQIVVRWTPSARATAYEVELHTADPALDRDPLPISWEETGTAVDGLVFATPYTFRIRASNAFGTSEWSVPASATTHGNGGPCVPDSSTLCLLAERFEVRVRWRVHGPQSRNGFATAAPAPGSDRTGVFTFFRHENVELVVKMLDGRASNGSFWLYYGALSDVEYWVSVRDTADGVASRTYRNEPSALCGRGDRRAFPGLGPESAARGLAGSAPEGPALRVSGADQGGGTCSATSESLCLAEGRFRVEVEWENQHDGGKRGAGRVFPGLESDQSGHFWFFRPDNLELSVKVLDGRMINDHFWIFWGGLSDLAYRIRVTDTETNETFDFENPAGTLCGGSSLDRL